MAGEGRAAGALNSLVLAAGEDVPVGLSECVDRGVFDPVVEHVGRVVLRVRVHQVVVDRRLGGGCWDEAGPEQERGDDGDDAGRISSCRSPRSLVRKY